MVNKVGSRALSPQTNKIPNGVTEGNSLVATRHRKGPSLKSGRQGKEREPPPGDQTDEPAGGGQQEWASWRRELENRTKKIQKQMQSKCLPKREGKLTKLERE